MELQCGDGLRGSRNPTSCPESRDYPTWEKKKKKERKKEGGSERRSENENNILAAPDLFTL